MDRSLSLFVSLYLCFVGFHDPVMEEENAGVPRTPQSQRGFGNQGSNEESETSPAVLLPSGYEFTSPSNPLALSRMLEPKTPSHSIRTVLHRGDNILAHWCYKKVGPGSQTTLFVLCEGITSVAFY